MKIGPMGDYERTLRNCIGSIAIWVSEFNTVATVCSCFADSNAWENILTTPRNKRLQLLLSAIELLFLVPGQLTH